MIYWHRLLGLLLQDFFSDTLWTVEIERDLSIRQQLLDILIVRGGEGTLIGQLPDGLAPLAEHNLISYKSLHEPLDDWTLKEVTGHYTNYRKQVSPADHLLPETMFRMIGVSTRFPQKLAGQLELKPVQPGVYETQRGTGQIRVIVLSQIPREPYNSLWHLFSGVPEAVRFGFEHYQQRTEVSTAISQLFEYYEIEGLTMPYTMEDLELEVARKHLKDLPPKERLEGLSPEQRLEGLAPEQIRAYLKRLEQQENGQSNGNGQD